MFSSHAMSKGYTDGAQLQIDQVIIMGLRSANNVRITPSNGASSNYDSARHILTVTLGAQFKIHDNLVIQYQ